MPERIYLDSCVVNRPTDDMTQERVRFEAEAIARILSAVKEGSIEWTSSSIVQLEVNRNPNYAKRDDTLTLLSLATTVLSPTRATIQRGTELYGLGFGRLDALHLALAEQSGATSLLTVDDRFIRRAASVPNDSSLTVENPVNWLRRRQPWLIKR